MKQEHDCYKNYLKNKEFFKIKNMKGQSTTDEPEHKILRISYKVKKKSKGQKIGNK